MLGAWKLNICPVQHSLWAHSLCPPVDIAGSAIARRENLKHPLRYSPFGAQHEEQGGRTTRGYMSRLAKIWGAFDTQSCYIRTARSLKI